MRGLVAGLAVAWAVGVWLGDRHPETAHLALAAAAGACAIALLLRRAPPASAIAACLAALAAGAGLMGVRIAHAEQALAASPANAVLEGRVAGVERLPSGSRLALEGTVWEPSFDPRPSRVEMWLEASAQPPPRGARARAAVRTRAVIPGVANPGGRDPARALARRGIAAAARVRDPQLLQIVEQPACNPASALANRRDLAIAALRRLGRGGGLLAALGLGDPAGLPERDRRAWAALGIAHLLSVSGLHLALAAAAAFALAARAAARSPRFCARWDARRVGLGAAFASAALYAALAGLATPALRSLAMLACLAAAVAWRRPASGAHALAAAALLVLALEPAALFAPGAQLSFAATAALVLGRASLAEHTGGRARRALATTLSTTARATLATAPIAALHFGASPPLAGVANLLAIPLTAALGMPLAFGAAAWALAAPHAPVPGLVALAARAAESALDAALALAAAAPAVAPQPPSLWALAIAAALAGLGLRTRRLGARLLCAALAQSVLAFAPPPEIDPLPPRIAFLDVGHGDATLVQARDFALLVDAGASSPDGWDAGARIVVPALAALGVRSLDALAITHADLDHRGGAHAVLAAFPVRALWLPRGALRDAAFAPLAADARARGVPVVERGAGDPPLVGPDVRVTPLWPLAGASDLGDNDRSLVLRVELPRLRALLLGDLEARGEAALLGAGAALRADVVKLAHHGSRSSSTAELLGAVRPRLAIASAPLHGRFGWPHARVRERLAAFAIPLAWTGRDGALLVSAGARPCLRAWRARETCAPFADLVSPRASPERSRGRSPP